MPSMGDFAIGFCIEFPLFLKLSKPQVSTCSRQKECKFVIITMSMADEVQKATKILALENAL